MSANNSYRFVIPKNEKYINVSLEIKWDLNGRQDDIDVYEKEVVRELTTPKGNFEISRYSHKEYGLNNETSLTYEFNFYNSSIPVSSTTILQASLWQNTYLFNSANPSGFSVTELYYSLNPFKKSFFKLDFYDTPDQKTQKNYFTIILPTQQGFTEVAALSPLIPNVNVKKPLMKLDFVGDKEGFFIYWLRSPDYINIDTFYMSAKFFDGKNGAFVRMMTTPQALLSNKFIFDTDQFFYYKVLLDYNTKKYEVRNNLNVRVGNGTPLRWFEYINP